MLPEALVTLFAAAVLAAPSLAQQTPDLSGTWKLDVKKSDFGQMPAPTSRTDVIEQHGSNIKLSVVSELLNGKQQYTLTFSTDGKEITFPSESGPRIGPGTLHTVSAAWQGSSLVVKEMLDFRGSPVTATNTYSVSPDGKTLKLNSDMRSPMGERVRKLVFERYDSSAAAASPASVPVAAARTAIQPAPGASRPRPNLTGTWTLNIPKSDFGQFPPPDSRIDKIAHNEPSVRIEINQTGGPIGDINLTMDLMTDGNETTATIYGNEAKQTAHWDGNSLVVSSRIKMQDGDFAFSSNYTLGDDGKTLNVATHFSGPQGENEQKLVFEKQP